VEIHIAKQTNCQLVFTIMSVATGTTILKKF